MNKFIKGYLIGFLLKMTFWFCLALYSLTLSQSPYQYVITGMALPFIWLFMFSIIYLIEKKYRLKLLWVSTEHVWRLVIVFVLLIMIDLLIIESVFAGICLILFWITLDLALVLSYVRMEEL